MKKAFTLIELLIVIAIIAILAAILFVSIGTAPLLKSRDAKRAADLQNLRTALALYYNDKGYYPATTDLATELQNGYIGAMPRDPKDPGTGSSIASACGSFTPNYLNSAYTGTATAGWYGYRYAAVTSTGAACTTAGGNCTNWVLGACMEQTDVTKNPSLQSSCHNTSATPPCALSPEFDVHS